MTAKRRPDESPQVPPICAAIAEALAESGLTGADVARKVGFAQNMMSRYIREVEPSLEMVSGIENALGLPLGDLFVRAGYVDQRRVSVARAVQMDRRLDKRAKGAMLALYRALAR